MVKYDTEIERVGASGLKVHMTGEKGVVFDFEGSMQEFQQVMAKFETIEAYVRGEEAKEPSGPKIEADKEETIFDGAITKG
jgi:hypothetical protein